MNKMGKGEKKGKSASRRIKSKGEKEEQQRRRTASQIEVVVIDGDSDDDTEANEDLSLKIVEKAMLRKCDDGSSSKTDFVVLDDDEIVVNFADDKSKKKENKKKKRKKIEAELKSVSSEKDAKFENFCSDLFLVDTVKEEEKFENEKTAEVVDEAVETNPVEVSDNTVLRKLLRGPRYFDPPDGSWGACYNCGEEGHMAVNCTSAKRKKPCFVCGSLEHIGKQCSKGKDCYICRKGGHRAKDCPEKSRKGAQNSKLCLKCGDSGHDMFLCGNDYFPDDLKEIECYVCGSIGHLCCVNYTNFGLKEITCYRCGLSGHTGLACSGSHKKMAIMGSASCFRCGEQGHFARECTNSSEGGKRNSESYTPKWRMFKENRDHIEGGSAPHDLGKTRKRKKTKHERGFSSASKPKGKYGWSTEHPGDFSNSKAMATPWKSPATPNNMRFRMPDYSTSDHASTSYSPWDSRSLHYHGSSSNGSATFNQPRYEHWNSDHSASYGSGMPQSNRFASRISSNSVLNGTAEFYQPRFEPRFDNNSSFGRRRNYNW